MKTTGEYLKEAKSKLNATDYRMAKLLGITQSATSNYALGKRVMDDTTAAKLAGLLGIEAMEIIAAANAEREKGEKKEFWENFYKRLGGIAAGIFVAVTLIVSPTPSQAAPMLNLDGRICILC
jgi:transcriptional regulator with XRE-family HTH domain